MDSTSTCSHSHRFLFLYSAIGLASSEVIYEPLGVSLILSAWNYPIYTALPQVGAAIAAGNCIILKPSEFAPHTSKVLKKLFEKYLDPSKSQLIQDFIELLREKFKWQRLLQS